MKHHFASVDGSQHRATIDDPFKTLQKKVSTWTPNSEENTTLDSVINAINGEVERLLPLRPTGVTNITDGERKALKDLKKNRNLIIKSADKGGATVVLFGDTPTNFINGGGDTPDP